MKRLLVTAAAIVMTGCSFLLVTSFTGFGLGPIDRPSTQELNALADKIERLCPETRYWGGAHVDWVRGRVRGPRLTSGLTERELSLVDADEACNIGPVIS